MLQRIQTVYLLIVAVISGGLIFTFDLWTTASDVVVFAKDELVVFGLFLGSAVLALISVFSYKNRKSQFMLGRLNQIFNIILLVVFVYLAYTASGEASDVSEKGVGIFLPVISIVFLILSNRAIKKDEDLVKSVDRLR